MSTIRPVVAAAAAVAALVIAGPAVAQITNHPFPDPIPASEGVIVVGLEEFAALPDIDGAPARPMVLVDEPGSGRLFVNDMWGLLYGITYDGSVTQYLDAREPRWGVLVETPELAPIIGSRAPELRVPPAIQRVWHGWIRKVLHMDRHGRNGSGSRLRSRQRRRHARHCPPRVDRPRPDSRDVRRRPAKRAVPRRAALRESQRRPDRLQPALVAGRSGLRFTVRRYGGWRRRGRPIGYCTEPRLGVRQDLAGTPAGFQQCERALRRAGGQPLRTRRPRPHAG